MAGWFIMAIIFAILTLIAFFVWRSLNRKHARIDETDGSSRQAIRAAKNRWYGKWTFVGVASLTGLFLLLSCLTVIGTKKIGVPTNFGKPEPSIGNGLHLKAPWWKMTELDGAIQTDVYALADKQRDGKPITVRIGNQSTAGAEVTIRWRIRKVAAPDLFRDYRNFDHIRESLVTQDLKVALNDTFAHYNPLGNLAKKVVTPPASLESLSTQVKQKLVGQDGKHGRIGNQIEVLSVFVPILHFDDATQKKINEYQAEKANTRIALQRIQTAQNESTANNKLKGSLANDPYVLVSKCFDIWRDMEKSHQSLPAGVSCWPGGGSAAVIASGSKSTK